MKTVARWYPGEEELSYIRWGEEVQDEFERNPSRILGGALSLATRRLTPKLTVAGKEAYYIICTYLVQHGVPLPIKRNWDKKCGCGCGCSPGYRLRAQSGSLFKVYTKGGRIDKIFEEGSSRRT